MMRRTLLAFLMLLAACRGTPSGGDDGGAADLTGKESYLKVNLWYEAPDRILSTNYHRGTMMPAGTKVRVISCRRGKITFETVEGGARYTLEHVRKHSRISLNELLARHFSERNPMAPGGPFQGFSAMEQQNVRAGRIAVGMSKEAVLMAYGYPPTHRTRSIDLDRWVYWTSRYHNFAVEFSDGRVSRTGR